MAKPADPKTGSSPSSRSIEAKAVADKSFKDFLPDDARYRVTKIKVTLARGKRPVGSPVEGAGSVGLSALASQAKPGDRYVVEVDGVERRNFKDQNEKVNMTVAPVVIPLE
jgi:hypothetical protein